MIDTLNAALHEAMADPEIVKVWADTGVAPYPPDATHARRRRRPT